ncbi:MAG: SPOR domain-containing protein, partial [Pseudomonadota bacterium]|nr:SPOR domain-containing protein [Pseudomonadota bacterium]
GSFSDTSNGENLLQRLQNAGYKAYTRNIDEGQEELLGVFVGPWVERALADEHLTQLQDQFQLVGMVVRYEVKQL